MNVMIGVDPHKATHTAVAVDGAEVELAAKTVRATRRQVDQLLAWAEPLGSRTWAIESAGGLGFLLSQQLVAAGEQVLDVPATLVARTRLLGTGRSNKNDPNDARSVAVAALRNPSLRQVQRANYADLLRLLARRNTEIGNQRSRVVSRLHALLLEIAPGGIAKEINASDVHRFLAGVDPITASDQLRFELAGDLLGEIEALDAQLKASHKRIRDAVAASGTSVTDIYGVGPILAAGLVGYSGDITRFATRDNYAAYNGTAPVEYASGGRGHHRLSRRGNRRLNHTIHMVAICQIRQRDSDGRAYYERRVTEGKTKKDAIRSLKRHISNTVYRHLVADAANTDE